MKKRISVIILICIVAFCAFCVGVSAYEYPYLPDMKTRIPDEILEYHSWFATDNVYENLFEYMPGLTTAETFPVQRRLSIVVNTFMSRENKEWIEEYTAYDTISYDFSGIDSFLDNPVKAYVLPESVVRGKYERMFGKDVYFPKESFSLYTGHSVHFIRDIIDGETVYIYYASESWGGGDSAGGDVRRIYNYEYTDDGFVLYENYFFGWYEADGDYNGEWEDSSVFLYADTVCNVPIGTFPVLEYKSADRFDQKYYAQYLHTFKSNGEGGYYWYSTELIGIGGKPVDEVIPNTSDCSHLYFVLAVGALIASVIILLMKRKLPFTR